MITFVVNSCRPRVVVQKYVHTFPDGDVECRPEMVKRRFRINRVKYVLLIYSKNLLVINSIRFCIKQFINYCHLVLGATWRKTDNIASRYPILKWKRFQEALDVNGSKNRFAKMHQLHPVAAKTHQIEIVHPVTWKDNKMEHLIPIMEYMSQVIIQCRYTFCWCAKLKRRKEQNASYEIV